MSLTWTKLPTAALGLFIIINTVVVIENLSYIMNDVEFKIILNKHEHNNAHMINVITPSSTTAWYST